MKQFILYTALILLCSSPLFFFIMKAFYASDLDELILYRSEEFVEDHLPTFTADEIEFWNKYNEDMQILPVDKSYPIGQVVQKTYYNQSEGHPVNYRVYYREIDIQGIIYVLMSRIAMIENKDLIGTLIGQFGLLGIMLLGSVVLTQRAISKKVWRPFYSSLHKVDKFDLNKGNIPHFDRTDIKEFNWLNTILSNLINNNQKAYNQQKEFIQNASHELQTPLAVFQSKLDVFFQQPDLAKEQVETIHSLYDILSRLTRLNKNLLLLAKIDSNQFKNIETIDFNQIVDNQLDYLTVLAESDGITITTIQNSHIVLSTNKVLLEILINNLIVNAIRHNLGTKEARVFIHIEKDSFVVENTGEKKPLDTKKIFQRFSRTSEEKKGNGLGLSIIYQICKLHNWQIEYSYQHEMHRFEVKF